MSNVDRLVSAMRITSTSFFVDKADIKAGRKSKNFFAKYVHVVNLANPNIVQHNEQINISRNALKFFGQN